MDENEKSDQQTNIRNWVLQRRKRRSDLPYEEIETEGERQLKALAKKQLDTDVTLQGELRKRKEFSTAQVFEPLGASVSGPVSLQRYQTIAKQDSRLEVLRSYGLDEDEIRLKLASEKSSQPRTSKSLKYGTDPLALQAQLDKIEQKILDKTTEQKNAGPKKFHGAKVMSRHEMDLENAISHSKENADLLKILVTDQPKHKSGSDSPESDVKKLLNQIETGLKGSQDLEENNVQETESETDLPQVCVTTNERLYPSTGCEECDKLRMMDRYFVGPLLKTDYDYYEKCDKCKQLKYKIEERRKLKGKKVDDEKGRIIAFQEEKAVTSKKRVKNAKEDNKPVVIDDNIEAIPIKIITKYRLTVEQICDMQRFADYTPGVVNKVLYLKNLSNKVTIQDLMSIFVHFQKPDDKEKIMVKLLTGRMRGQAFVYFPDERKAEEALNMVNGYDFKGKPIVIQFGKKG